MKNSRYKLSLFSLGMTLVDVLLNWLKWFHFLILEGSPLVIVIDSMNFLLPFLEITRTPM